MVGIILKKKINSFPFPKALLILTEFTRGPNTKAAPAWEKFNILVTASPSQEKMVFPRGTLRMKTARES